MRVPLTPLFPKVGDFQLQPIGIGKKDREIIRRVFGIIFRLTQNNLVFLKSGCRFAHFLLGCHAQAEMVQARPIRIMPLQRASRAQDITEMAIIILNMPLTIQLKAVFTKCQHLHQDIVESFRLLKVGYRQVYVVDSNYFRHGIGSS